MNLRGTAVLQLALVNKEQNCGNYARRNVTSILCAPVFRLVVGDRVLRGLEPSGIVATFQPFS